jgi:predicted RNA-binding protein with PUA-like domain
VVRPLLLLQGEPRQAARHRGQGEPAPRTEQGDWASVEVAPLVGFVRPVGLAQVKADGALKDFALVTRTRLPVALVTGAQFVRVLALAGTRLPRG